MGAARRPQGLLPLIPGQRLTQPEFHRRYAAYPEDAKFELIGVPPILFKFFASAEHAAAFVGRGTLRIGTLYDFRNIESHDSVRGERRA